MEEQKKDVFILDVYKRQVQYKFLGYDMFEEMTKNIRHDTVGALMHVQIEQKVERKQVARATGTNKDELVERGDVYKRQHQGGSGNLAH